jgi:hypothetical protein
MPSCLFSVNATTAGAIGWGANSESNGKVIVVNQPMRTGLWLALLGVPTLVGLPGLAHAQAVGSEFQINTYTTSNQRTVLHGGRLAAADANGNFVVVWSSSGQDGSGYGIVAQRYDSAGVELGSEFPVNSFTPNSQRYASVAAAAGGGFVVVWGSSGQDGSGYGIFGQRYDGGGTAQGAEFRVNSSTTGDQRFPSVSAAADGDFVVIWEGQGPGDSSGIFGQRYDDAGSPRGGEFRVNSYTTGLQEFPSVAADASGNFVVVWGRAFGSYYLDVRGQRFDSGGAAQGAEFLIDDVVGFLPPNPDHSVASDASGNFVVVWRTYSKLLGQRYDSNGDSLGQEFTVSPAPRAGIRTSAASDASGNFVVVWEGQGQGDSSGIFGRRYDSGGVPQGNEFRINSFTTGDQQFPSVAATGPDAFVVAWESDGQDGSAFGAFGQRYDFGADAITVVSPNTNVKWRIASVKEIQWTHNLGVDATFRIKLDRNGDGEYEELIAAAAPASSDTAGSFLWTVIGPPTKTARVRIAWTGNPAISDASDVTFQIRPPS